MKTSGIYRIEHPASGRCYIGRAVHIEYRWHTHKSALRRGVHHSQKLQHAWTKHGEQSFVFKIVEAVEPTDLIGREQYWLDTIKPFFNIQTDASNGGRLGMKHTDEAKAKISASNKGKNIGRRPSPETIEKLRAIQKANNYRHSPEMRALMSQRRKGIQLPADAIARMKATLTGRKLSDAHRKNIGDARRGIKHSLETCEKLSQVRRANIAARHAAGLPTFNITKRRKDAKLSVDQMTSLRSEYVPGHLEGSPNSAEGRRKTVGLTIKQLGEKYGVGYLTAWKAVHGKFRGAICA